MITTFEVQGFRCLKDVSAQLTPLHAFIGPNDSGKSTLLSALRLALRGLASGEKAPGMVFTVRAGHQWSRIDAAGKTDHKGTNQEAWQRFGVPTIFRVDPDDLRQPTPLVHDGQAVVLSERGQGLAGAYDALLSRDRRAFDAIEARVRDLFPTLDSLQLRSPDGQRKVLGARLRDGTEVRVGELSEGLLYYLAFAILPHASGAKLVLVEEPENGLHPSRIADVMRILRALSESGTQVLLATHSPLVVNELRPEEVSIVTRDLEKGTQVRRIADTPNFARRSQVYALGELWLSYANGIDEGPLLAAEGTAEPSS